MGIAMKLTIEIDIMIDKNNVLDDDIMGQIHYPNEGNVIFIKKGLNTIELSKTIHHEIGHLIDWYLSNRNQSTKTGIREQTTDLIGETIRFKGDANEN